MQWRIPWLRSNQPADPQLRDKQALLEEVEQARIEWQHAARRLDYVVDPDQIDYVIFAMEAAEKRYEMLLKHAKRMNLHALHLDGENLAAAAGEEPNNKAAEG